MDSPHFKNGQFRNLNPTPQFAEGYSFVSVFKDFLFRKTPHKFPTQNIPTIKTDLKSIAKEEDVLVWFGHSSYFFQLDSKRFLVDPVFSNHASPIPGMIKAFSGTEIYSAEDMPEIDYLIITHDHYDHLDYKTIMQLRSKVNRVVCGLGVGKHFKKWKYDASKILETDWYDVVNLGSNHRLYTLPARHFSGRGLFRNRTLWCSFLLKTQDFKLYIGGDSGYDTHFKKIGEKFGNIDLAILENGQYNAPWRYIHMFPEEVLQAANDLQTKRLFPVHSAKFSLAPHAWKAPLEKISELNQTDKTPLLTPMIGELVYLKNADQDFSKWWESVD